MPDKYGKKSEEELEGDERYFEGVEYDRRNLFPVPKNAREKENAKMYAAKQLRDETADYKAKHPPSNALREILGYWLNPEDKKQEPAIGGDPDTNENYQTSEGYEYDESGKKKPRNGLRSLFGK